MTPQFLAKVIARLDQPQPGLIGQLLGGGGQSGAGGTAMDHPLVKAALAGITAMAVKKMMGGR